MVTTQCLDQPHGGMQGYSKYCTHTAPTSHPGDTWEPASDPDCLVLAPVSMYLIPVLGWAWSWGEGEGRSPSSHGLMFYRH